MTTFLLPSEIWDAGRGANVLTNALADTQPTDLIFVPGYVLDTGGVPQSARIIRVDVGEGFVSQDVVEARLRKIAEDPNAVVISPRLTKNDTKGGSGHNHRVHHVGKLKVVTVDADAGSYRAQWLRGSCQGKWIDYGAGQPIFTYNTNNFDEASPSKCDTYVVVASGLLGLKMIIESSPDPDARIVIFDINQHQLDWSHFVIEHAGEERDFTALNAAFQAERPELSLRAVLPHERANAKMQNDWFANHHRSVAALRDNPITWIRANLLHDPNPVLSQLPPEGQTFFMYLDIFLPWLHGEATPTVLDLRQLAAEFRAEVIDRTNSETQFLPREIAHEIQLPEHSPW
ncbi:hypothetical protein [Roseibium aggregatum]|uniref:hypothetical protein n=1 Tax=Roseibium aggregatum TaxID=187304 RepID=UPI0025AD378F|nr:hypothetical protein [Roseibium aggregatum]WJS05546.1 hypothetical protein QUB73_26770 [Roseibium aggregatum]